MGFALYTVAQDNAVSVVALGEGGESVLNAFEGENRMSGGEELGLRGEDSIEKHERNDDATFSSLPERNLRLAATNPAVWAQNRLAARAVVMAPILGNCKTICVPDLVAFG